MLSVGLGDVVDAAYVRMGDLPGQPNFLMEPREPVGTVGDLLGQELESHRLTELQVFRSIHFAHAALPQQSDNAIPFDKDRSGNEARIVDGVE